MVLNYILVGCPCSFPGVICLIGRSIEWCFFDVFSLNIWSVLDRKSHAHHAEEGPFSFSSRAQSVSVFLLNLKVSDLRLWSNLAITRISNIVQNCSEVYLSQNKWMRVEVVIRSFLKWGPIQLNRLSQAARLECLPLQTCLHAHKDSDFSASLLDKNENIINAGYWVLGRKSHFCQAPRSFQPVGTLFSTRTES